MPSSAQVEFLALTREMDTLAVRKDAIRNRLEEIANGSQDRIGMGDIVVSRGEEFMVSAKPWLVGCSRNRDGTWSARQTYLRADWKLKDYDDA